MSARSTRQSQRLKLDIPLTVVHKLSVDKQWIEETKIEEANQLGAGFRLNRPVEAGRLVHLTMPMPGKLRAYDFKDKQYSIWAVVRYIRLLSTDDADHVGPFNIGVAFIGKEPPDSFILDPTARYELKPVIAKEGLWVPRERPRQSGRYAFTTDRRVQMALKVIIESFNERGEITNRQETETENISTGGAAVWTNISPDYENFIRFTSIDKKISILSIVRGQHNDANRGQCLHLEFISSRWPLEE
jgi:hypothetical protein